MTDTRWLTYDELAEALGINPDSARRLVARKKWPRKQNNEGRALIAVPMEYLERERDKPPVTSPDISTDDGQDDSPDVVPDDTPDVTRAVSILTQHIDRLEKELEAVKVERDAERASAARLAQQVTRVEILEMLIEVERKRTEDERQRAEDERQKVENERLRTEELRAERDKWSAALEASQRQISHLTDKAAMLEKRRGWWPFRRAG